LLSRQESWPDDPAIDPQVFVFVCAVHQDHAGDFLWVLIRIYPRNQAAPRVTDKNVRTLDACASQEQVKFIRGRLEAPRCGPWVTPGLAGTVVGTRFVMCSYTWLNQSPIERIIAQPMKKNDRGTTVADAVDVNLESAQVHQFARGWRHRSLLRGGKGGQL
jgi:hypothetical protein